MGASRIGLAAVVQRIRDGYEDRTPGGGVRWLVKYPASVTWCDCTLARRPGRAGEPSVKTLIELPTFAIMAPSKGPTHPSGRPYTRVTGGFTTIAAYTVDERDRLFTLARTFDEMPRREVVRPATRPSPVDGTRPGDDFNRRMTWRELLEPAGWRHLYDRGETTYWRRPGKDHGGPSATTNHMGSDLFYPFTSSTAFEHEKSYSKFAVYTALEHGGDFRRAARALAKLGYGSASASPTQRGAPQGFAADRSGSPLPVVTSESGVLPEDMSCNEPNGVTRSFTLVHTEATFRRWLHLEDPSPLHVVAATLVANRAPGDPVWLLLVCAPSTGKTEILSSATSLPWVVSAAKVTEGSLLSGTSRKEKARDATGGLLRQIGNFGVLLCKDFTSVLSQHKEARAEAMAALREVYDGSWHRPVGTDGGRVLSWQGKAGFIGGVTPAIDRFGEVLTALGDRFVLLRMGDADVEAFGAAALRHGGQETAMRRELAEAMASLVEHADASTVNRARSEDEQRRLIHLAAYTARARTAVVRDHQHEVQFLPQVEGPGRLVKVYAHLLGGLEAIGCDERGAWTTLTRVAIDCAPALRTRVIRELMSRRDRARTAVIAMAAGIATKTASRYLEDLALLNMAERDKVNESDNSPDFWSASEWLREYWPDGESGTGKSPPSHQTHKGDQEPHIAEPDREQSDRHHGPTFEVIDL